MNGFDALYKKAKDHVLSLSELPSRKEESVEQMLECRGIERRDFMKWTAGITAMLALPSQFTPFYHQGLGGVLYEPMRAVEAWIGGPALVRYIHHIAMWGFLIFIPIHIYLLIWSAIRFKHGTLDIMFTRYDYHLKKEQLKKDKK